MIDVSGSLAAETLRLPEDEGSTQNAKLKQKKQKKNNQSRDVLQFPVRRNRRGLTVIPDPAHFRTDRKSRACVIFGWELSPHYGCGDANCGALERV